MTEEIVPSELAGAYADAVRAMLGPRPAAAAERGGGGPAGDAAGADALAGLSRDMTAAIAPALAAPDTATRADAAARLLAKAVADLEVTGALAAAAEDGAGGPAAGAERSTGAGDVEEALAVILGGARDAVLLERGGEPAAAGAASATDLEHAVEDVLDLVEERATRAGQAALTGLLGLGATELAGAVGVVGTDLAALVGKGEAAARAVAAVGRLAAEAGNGVTALLGPTVAGAAAAQVAGWVDAVREGEKFGELLAKLYDTPTVLAQTQALVAAAAPDGARLAATTAAVNGIDAAYAGHVKLAERILQKSRFLAAIPAAVVPQGRLLLGAIYLGLGGYVVLAGADFVDSPRLRLLARYPGVKRVVADGLGAGDAG